MGINFFSIIVPAYERPQALWRCLEALSMLNYPRDKFEVIVVDDGSKKPLMPFCEPFKSKFDLTYVSQPNSGAAAARNKGVAHARGRYLAFTDDDCMPTSGWLKAMNIDFNENPACAVAGRMENFLHRNPYSTASQFLIDYLHEYYNKYPNRARFFTTSSFGLTTEGFHEIGGFDSSFPRAAAEDRDFCARWLHAGRKIFFDPKVVVLHSHLLSFNTYFKQHFNYGRGAFHYHRKCKLRGEFSLRIEPFRFYAGLILKPFLNSGVKRKLFISMLLLLSQVANANGYFWEMKPAD